MASHLRLPGTGYSVRSSLKAPARNAGCVSRERRFAISAASIGLLAALRAAQLTDLRWLRVVGCLVPVPALLAIAASCEGRNQPSSLELEEVSSLAFPDSMAITGVKSDGKGRFVAWGAASGTIASLEERKWRLLRISDNATSVAGVGYDSLGTTQALILEADESGGRPVPYIVSIPPTAASRIRIDVPARVVQGVRASDRWYLAAVASDSSMEVYSWTSDERARALLRIPPRTGMGAHIPRVHLSLDLNELLITRADSPFTVQRTDRAGKSLTSASPLRDHRVLDALAATPNALWVSLPAVALDVSVIQTLADLRSEQRVFVVSNRAGRVHSVGRLSTPLGFVDSDIPGRLVCAVRTLNTRELVCYRWSHRTKAVAKDPSKAIR